MISSSTTRLLFALWGLAAIAGCRSASPEGDDTATPLYHHNWWNYYQRGMERFDRGEYAGAQMDFERCLGRRAGATYGYPFDVWRARTYGLHFVEGYFPNRELGICRYYLGDMTNAQTWLETSLKQQPSGRAKYFLNLARKKQFLQQPPPPPNVTLTAPFPSPWQKNRHLILAGEARGMGRIAELRIDGRPEFIELAETAFPFSRRLPLREGNNAFIIAAYDLIGQTTTSRFDCIADWRPPELLIKSLHASSSGWLVEGLCLDDHALVRVGTESRTFLDQSASSTGAPPTRIALRWELPKQGSQLFIAQDAAGNELRAVLSAESLRQGKGPYSLAAHLEPGVTDAGSPATPFPKEETDSDRLPPDLRIATASKTMVYDDEYFLDAEVSDAGGLASVTIDGNELLSQEQQGFIHARLARRLPLVVGTNTFHISATDPAGNKESRELHIIRKQPAYLDTFCRLTLRLFPVFTPPSAAANGQLPFEQVRNVLEGALLDEPPRFWVLEREENLDAVLREHLLSLSDLSDPRAVLRLGKILPAELLMTTALIPHGQGATVLATIMDPDRGIALCSEDVYLDNLSTHLAYQLEGLAMKVEQNFPLMAGKITQCSSDKARVSVGQDEGLRQGTRLLVIKPPAKDGGMEQGQVVMYEGKPVALIVASAEADQAAARVVPKQAGQDLEKGYFIYAK